MSANNWRLCPSSTKQNPDRGIETLLPRARQVRQLVRQNRIPTEGLKLPSLRPLREGR